MHKLMQQTAPKHCRHLAKISLKEGPILLRFDMHDLLIFTKNATCKNIKNNKF